MPPTTLRRRGPPYAVRQPPHPTAETITAAAQATWSPWHDAAVYHRSWARWTYLEGGDPEDFADVVDPSTRRDAVATLPRAALPTADPWAGTDLGVFHTAATPDEGGWPAWEPVIHVHAVAADPVTGQVVIYWHREDEWHFDVQPSTLHITQISPGGAVLHRAELLPRVLSWPGPIDVRFGHSDIWAIEPDPAADYRPEDGMLPFRVVRRAALAVTASRTIEGWSGLDSICPRPDVDAAYLFLQRRHIEGTGPYPSWVDPFSNVYDASYVLPLDSELAGAEQLLSFGHDGTTEKPWALDELEPWGRSTILDSITGGVPRFVSLAADPDQWPGAGATEQIWRFRLDGGDEAREAGAGRQSAAYPGGWYWRTLERRAAGEYFVHPGRDAGVGDFYLEELP